MSDSSDNHLNIWVTKPKAAEVIGLTVRQIEGRIQRGSWSRGEHYAVIDGITMINLQSVDALHHAMANLQLEPKGRDRTARQRKIGRLV